MGGKVAPGGVVGLDKRTLSVLLILRTLGGTHVAKAEVFSQ